MRRFLARWLVWIVILVFAAALLFTYPALTTLTESSAEQDLAMLLDAAFTRLTLMQSNEEAVSASSNGNVLAKARAIDRFVSHDDTLMQTDALVTLGELLSLSAIDVTDAAGEVVASSIAGHIGRNVLEDDATAWTSEVAQGEGVEKTHIDEENHALLTGCVPRTDTDGLVLVQTLDIPILNAEAAAEPEQVLRDMSFIRDEITVPETTGEDLTYYDANNLYVRRTRDNVTFVASRSLAQVHLLRSAVMLCEAIGMLACVVFSAVLQILLFKRERDKIRLRKTARTLVSTDALSALRAEGALAPAAELGNTGDIWSPLAYGDTEAADEAAREDAEAHADTPKKRRSHKRFFGLIEVIEDDDERENAPDEALDEAPDAPDSDGSEEGGMQSDAQEADAPHPAPEPEGEATEHAFDPMQEALNEAARAEQTLLAEDAAAREESFAEAAGEPSDEQAISEETPGESDEAPDGKRRTRRDKRAKHRRKTEETADEAEAAEREAREREEAITEEAEAAFAAPITEEDAPARPGRRRRERRITDIADMPEPADLDEPVAVPAPEPPSRSHLPDDALGEGDDSDRAQTGFDRIF